MTRAQLGTGPFLQVGYDPHTPALYLRTPAAVAVGDRAAVDGVPEAFRVIDLDTWGDPGSGSFTGLVVYLAAEPEMPDVAAFARPGDPVWDREANTEVPGWAPLGTWPVLVEAPSTGSTGWAELEVGGQRVGVQPLLVTVPLELADVRPGDRMTVQTSADARLVGRPLEVARVTAGSLLAARQLIVLDNLG